MISEEEITLLEALDRHVEEEEGVTLIINVDPVTEEVKSVEDLE